MLQTGDTLLKPTTQLGWDLHAGSVGHTIFPGFFLLIKLIPGPRHKYLGIHMSTLTLQQSPVGLQLNLRLKSKLMQNLTCLQSAGQQKVRMWNGKKECRIVSKDLSVILGMPLKDCLARGVLQAKWLGKNKECTWYNASRKGTFLYYSQKMLQ